MDPGVSWYISDPFFVSPSRSPNAFTPQTPAGDAASTAPAPAAAAPHPATIAIYRRRRAGVAAGTRLEGEVGYGLPVGRRFVGTPTLGVRTSATGRDYRLGYRLGMLDRESLNVELGVEAQRRARALPGGTSTGALGRATVRW